MPQWNLDPKKVASIIMLHQPYEAEEIVLDFLEEAGMNNEPDQTAFWVIVHNLIEQMQSQLAEEPDYAPEIRFAAVM